MFFIREGSNCFRFARPAEASWRLEAGELDEVHVGGLRVIGRESRSVGAPIEAFFDLKTLKMDPRGLQKAYFVRFGSALGSILVPKSFGHRSQREPKPPKTEFWKPFGLQVRSGGAPGVPWGELGASRTSFWAGLGLPNPSKIDEKSTSEKDAFSETFFL